MNIPVVLNGNKVMLLDDADTPLLSVLRKNKLYSTKHGCEKGMCGSCTVLLDGKPVPSCKVPVSLAVNRNIQTLESFRKTEEYQDIMKGFSKAGIKLCGFCDTGKIFAARSILLSPEKPNRNTIHEEVSHLSPCCTDEDTLINGILYAVEYHMKRVED